MKAVLEDGKNIYLQISQAIEDDILAGLIKEEELIPSKNQIAKHFQINPVTALRGVSLLADEGIVYPKRGIGMCVASGARELILQKRRKGLYETYVRTLIREAQKLGVCKSELIKMIESGETHE